MTNEDRQRVSLQIPRCEAALLKVLLGKQYETVMANCVLSFMKHLQEKIQAKQQSTTKTFKLFPNLSIVLKAYFHGAYSGQQGKLYSIALSIPQYKGDDHLEWMDYVAEMEQVLIEKILLKEP